MVPPEMADGGPDTDQESQAGAAPAASPADPAGAAPSATQQLSRVGGAQQKARPRRPFRKQRPPAAAATGTSTQPGNTGTAARPGKPPKPGKAPKPPKPPRAARPGKPPKAAKAPRPPRPEPRSIWLRPAHAAGVVLSRLTVLPAVLVVAWLVTGVPLLLHRSLSPGPMLLISVPVAVVLIVIGLRVVPAVWPRLPAGGTEPAWALWAGLLGTVVVVAALTAWQLTHASQALIVDRDQGVYLQTGYWLAQHGSLPIPNSLAAFGGAHAGLKFTTTGFLTRGSGLYPTVTSGLPLLLAAGFWAHGTTGAVLLGPILGGLALLSFAGLVARLVGPRWAPAGALALGISMPEQYAGRTTLSETALQIVLFGGLCLLADSLVLRAARPAAGWLVVVDPAQQAKRRIARAFSPERLLALLAGLALGFTLVVSLDALPLLLAVIPVLCVLVIGRRPQGLPLALGLVIAAGLGIAGLFLLDRPFLDSVGKTAGLAGVAAVWLAALSVIAIQLARIGAVKRLVPKALAARPLRWLPGAGAIAVGLALIGLLARPYLQTVHGHPAAADYDFVASLQSQQHLISDPSRSYAEQTLYWVIWYIGLPTVLLGAFGLALVLRRSLRTLTTWKDPSGVWRMWALPAAIIGAGTAVALWAPDIMPDQPWASRRLVLVAIPGLILGALWAASWLARRAIERGAKPLTAALAALFCLAAVLLPTVATTFGIGLTHSGQGGGLRPDVQEGMVASRIGHGQGSAVPALCARIPRNASVVMVDWPTASQFAQVVRGMCGVPTAWMTAPSQGELASVVSAISAKGRQPVLLASTSQRLARYSDGTPPVQVLHLATTGDPHQLTQLPTSPEPVTYKIWMIKPSQYSFGI